LDQATGTDAGLGHERLWNVDFWPHRVEHPRGLASLLSPDDELGEVTRVFIVIHKADGKERQFMRLDSQFDLAGLGRSNRFDSLRFRDATPKNHELIHLDGGRDPRVKQKVLRRIISSACPTGTAD
jgi:hypothetical protein